MGLWDILTKDIKLGSHELWWSEPMQFRARLKGDLIWRIAISLSAWLAASGILLVIFSFNQNPPARSVAFGLGAVFGMGPAVMYLFFRKNQVSGNIKLFRDRLERHKMSGGYIWRWMQTTTWGLAGIARFHLVPRDKAGLSFHVMFFKSGGEWDLIAIPSNIDLKKLRSLLSAGGAEVTPTNRIPDRFREPLPPAVAGVSGVVGIALALTGFLMFNPGDAPNRPQRPDVAQNLPQFPQPDLEGPRPVNPGFPGGGAPQNNDDLISDPADAFPGPARPPRGNPPGRPARPPGNGVSPPSRPAAGFSDDESIGIRSKLFGGTGGFPFTKVSAEQKPVVGVRYRTAPWDGQERLALVDPLFEREAAGPNDRVVVANSGYVLGAVEIHAPDKFVDGLRLVFVKQTAEGGLDFDDSYKSDWIGADAVDPVRLDQNGSPIIGFHGRGGAVVDALGVIFRG